jgi:hypothetical protein
LGGRQVQIAVCDVASPPEQGPGAVDGCAVPATRIEAREEGGAEGGQEGIRMENAAYRLTFSSKNCGLAHVVVKGREREGGSEGGDRELEVTQSFAVYESPGDSVYFFK